MKLNEIKMKRIYFWIFLALSFTSCAVVKTHTTKTTEIYGAGVIHKPVVVDLDVKDTKVTGSATLISGDMTTSKNEAVYDALKTSNADVLVEPKFDTERVNSKTKVIVTGYPGYYKNFRPATDKDTTVLKIGVLQKANVYEPVTVTKKKGAGAWALLGIISLVGLIAALSSI